MEGTYKVHMKEKENYIVIYFISDKKYSWNLYKYKNDISLYEGLGKWSRENVALMEVSLFTKEKVGQEYIHGQYLAINHALTFNFHLSDGICIYNNLYTLYTTSGVDFANIKGIRLYFFCKKFLVRMEPVFIACLINKVLCIILYKNDC